MLRKLPAQTILQWPLDDGKTMSLVCGRVLGKGGFGRCYQVFSREGGKRFACKVIDKQSPQFSLTRQKVRSEVGLHKRMAHPNIVQFQSCHEDEKFIYILLQLCTHNTLDDVLHRRKQLTEVQARYYMRQIIEGVAYMHEQRVVHRDLKLENFFISDQMTLKIGDFGLAAQLPTKMRRKSVCGTPHFMAPEIFTSPDGYSFQIDVWSLGVVAFLLLCGRFPFEDRSPEGMVGQIGKGLHFGRGISVQAQDFVGKMLKISPKERSTVRQLLTHDFLTIFEIPPSIPLSCLVCQPTLSFTGKYLSKRSIKPPLEEIQQDELKFQFLLQSKESPESHRGTLSPQLDYKIIQSEFAENQVKVGPQQELVDGLGREGREEEFYVRDWVQEYWEHPRQGLLYRTNNNLVGMRLNDGSNILFADHTKNTFLYFDKNESSPITFEINVRLGVSRDVKLKAAMLLRLSSGVTIHENPPQRRQREVLFMRLYLNTMQVFLIWLSDGTLQGEFRDGSQMVISRKGCLYMDDCGKCPFRDHRDAELPEHVKMKWRVIEDVLDRRKQRESDQHTV